MKRTHYISINDLCYYYNIDTSFVSKLHETGLLEITSIEDRGHIHREALSDFEKMIRLHRDLEINPEGIDVIFHLQHELDRLREELRTVKRQLKVFGRF